MKLMSAHVARPDEHGPGLDERVASGVVDLQTASLIELATRLGA